MFRYNKRFSKNLKIGWHCHFNARRYCSSALGTWYRVSWWVRRQERHLTAIPGMQILLVMPVCDITGGPEGWEAGGNFFQS